MKTITGLLITTIGLGAFLVMGASTADALPPSKGHASAYHQKVKKQKREAQKQSGARPKTVGVSITKHRRMKPYHLRKRGLGWSRRH